MPIHAMLRAAADPTRLRILSLLRGGEVCVCEIVDALRVPQPKTSRHLAYLRRVGLVTARKEGLWIHYRLAPAVSATHEKLLELLDCCGQELPQLAQDFKRLRKCC